MFGRNMQARMVLISLTRWISLSEQLCLTHMKFHYLNCGHAAPLLSSLPFHFSFRVLLWEWFLYIYLIKPIISVISPMALTNILFIPSILFISSSHVSLLKGRPTVRYVLILLLSHSFHIFSEFLLTWSSEGVSPEIGLHLPWFSFAYLSS